jgi:hypothetical protein
MPKTFLITFGLKLRILPVMYTIESLSEKVQILLYMDIVMLIGLGVQMIERALLEDASFWAPI